MKIRIYLISDSTAETVLNIARACLYLFDGFQYEEKIWSLVNSKERLTAALNDVRLEPGIIIYSLLDEKLSQELDDFAKDLGIISINVMKNIIDRLALYLGKSPNLKPGKKHIMDEGYYARIEAINFTIHHDDGQNYSDLSEADIIITGVSRSSKSPTSIYLAYRGYKTANVPFIIGVEYPLEEIKSSKKFTVGLIVNADRLIEIRKMRLITMRDNGNNKYIDRDFVNEELLAAKKLFSQNNWPIIDVSKRSIEETSAQIIDLYNMYNANSGK